ncbi:restriction endonuclease [Fodinibius salsisoli]|uniref:Restriction endonuclease n=1 Tax=Fodinibius salsisoli TaxID=2820877 RepID=A0ABT3PQA5_9BACT|nr:restriction endonuclease [Fodinibius salsisoli]MCW9708047.1 hypothetical protein [Fodinibius salsisoli]
MLRNVIEDYLSSIEELQLFEPFRQLLALKGYYDTHIVHSSTEFGKDIIAKKEVDGKEHQFSFQLKAKDVKTNTFRQEVRPQIIEAYTNKLSHPNFNTNLDYQVIFVTSGEIKQPASINFQQLNKFLETKLNQIRCDTWDKNYLVEKFLKVGIEPFYSLHKSTETAGSFISFYSAIKNHKDIDFLEIERYSKKWLDYDYDNPINRLEILFEAYFFSKLLIDDKRYYEALLIISSLVRVILKNDVYAEYKDIIEEYTDSLFQKVLVEINGIFEEGNDYPIIESTKGGIFKIFYYPILCHEYLELLSFCYLFSSSDELKENAFQLILKLLDEKGAFRPISDNYAITIVLVSLCLYKADKKEELKRYLNNVTVWLANRYKEIGISSLGSTREEEFEQLLSEYLEGYSYSKLATSFTANAVLDISYKIGDQKLYEDIANDLKAVELIPEFYHILNQDALYTYDDPSILTSNDDKFKLAYEDDYTKMIKHERANSSVELDQNVLFLIFLLRDRYFPTKIFNII